MSRRRPQSVYVLPQYVNGRLTEPPDKVETFQILEDADGRLPADIQERFDAYRERLLAEQERTYDQAQRILRLLAAGHYWNEPRLHTKFGSTHVSWTSREMARLMTSSQARILETMCNVKDHGVINYDVHFTKSDTWAGIMSKLHGAGVICRLTETR